MPKKPPRNAFYFYMQDFREEQRKIGNNFRSMAEVAEAAGPLWKEADHKTREKFEEKARREKQRLNQPNMKFTSQGVSYAEIERREKDKRDADQAERQDIANLVKLKAFSGELKQQEFFLMDVSAYCEVHGVHVVGELTLLRFSLAAGLVDQYHEMVHPGPIPLGYGSDARAASEQLGLALPDEEAPRSNFVQLLANVLDYTRGPDARAPPPLFTMPDKVAACASFLQQLCARAAQDEAMFRVYRADLLMFHVVNAHRTGAGDGFPRESLALMALQRDPFDYNPGLACDVHEAGERPNNCTLARTKRWAFTIFDYACPLAGLPQVPGRHLPADYDVENIQRFYEDKKTAQRAAPTVANVPQTAGSTCNSSVCSNDSARPGSRRAPPALSDNDFPRLCAGAGRGQAPRASAGAGRGQAPRASAGAGRGQTVLPTFRAMRLD